MPPKPKKRAPAIRRSSRLRRLRGSGGLFDDPTFVFSVEGNVNQPATGSSNSTLTSVQSTSAGNKNPVNTRMVNDAVQTSWHAYWDIDLKHGNLPPPTGLTKEELGRWNDDPVGDNEPIDAYLYWKIRDLTKLVLDFPSQPCVHHYVKGPDDVWGRLDQDTQNQLLTWAPQARMHLNSGEWRPFVSAWVWRMLYDNLFSPQAINKWSGDAWIAFGKLQEILPARVQNVDDEFTRTFHTAREKYARMLYSIHGEHVDPMKLKQKLIKPFEPLINRSIIHTVDSSMDFIVNAAIRLDIGIVASRTHIEVIMHDTESGKLAGFPFTVEPDPQESELLASLIEPRLEIFTDSDKVEAIPLEKVENLNVSYIARPLFRSYGRSLRITGLPGALSHSDDTSYVDFDLFKIERPLQVVLETPDT